MWLVLAFSYFFYMFRAGSEYNGCNSTGSWCKLVNDIITWLHIMVNLFIAETLVGCSVSMGNGEFSRNLARLIVGILSVGWFIFFPAWHSKTDAFIFTTNLEATGALGNAKFILVSFDVLLVLLQIRTLSVLYFFATNATVEYLGGYEPTVPAYTYCFNHDKDYETTSEGRNDYNIAHDKWVSDSPWTFHLKVLGI